MEAPDHLQTKQKIDAEAKDWILKGCPQVIFGDLIFANVPTFQSALRMYLKDSSIETVTEVICVLSGEFIKGWCYDFAQSNAATDLQKKDAEVACLQRADAQLQAYNYHLYNEVTLYIRGNRGPCDSCRGLIAEFRARFPTVRIVVEYYQSPRGGKDVVSKDISQKALTYGYGDAIQSPAGGDRYYKFFPAVNEGVVLGTITSPKGFKASNLEAWFQNLKRERSKDLQNTDRPVDLLPLMKTDSEENKEAVNNWLLERTRQEQSLAFSERDKDYLLALDTPQMQDMAHGKAACTAYIRLVHDITDAERKAIKPNLS